MRLKSVRIFGFKTFADRAEFNLDGGIVAVVGPNGCGKSNLVDAILWALGESNARHLRAQATQDVIFSGSARRRATGFAEVSLLFDNEDGGLPIDTSEVVITRRVARGGESEYAINRRTCRQRDVHELLADSGLGRAGYSIVGQKEIDQALAASPLDRRAWLDEAAGVQRYRVRKLEALKRLESATEHLVRVEDILREIAAQIEPLAAEAELARKYRSAANALRQIETGILIKEYAAASRETAELEQTLSASALLAKTEADRAESLDQESRGLRSRIAALEHEIESTRDQVHRASSASQRADAAWRLGEERLRSLDEIETSLASSDVGDRIEQTALELEQSRAEEALEQATLDRARTDLAGVGEQSKTVAGDLSRVDAELALARLAHAEYVKKRAEVDHRAERSELLARELAGLEQDLPRTEAEYLKAAGLEAEKRAEVDDVLSSIGKAESDKQASIRASEEAAAGIRKLLAERSALDGRMRGIEATLQAHEGLAQGSRAVLSAVESGALAGAYWPVGEVIETSTHLALAIETALGPAANHLICRSAAEAAAGIRYLKDRKLGRATFRPLDWAQTSMRPDLPSHPGILGIGADLVDTASEFSQVSEQLLGSILVVDCLDTALAIDRGLWVAVTLEGEICHGGSAISGGTAQHVGHGLLHRRAELGQIAAELAVIDAQLAAARQQEAERETALDAVRKQIFEQEERLATYRGELAEAQDFARALLEELESGRRSRARIEREMATLATPIDLGECPDLAAIQTRRDLLVNDLAARSADANLAKERLAESESRLNQAIARSTAISRRLESQRNAEQQRTLKLEGLEPQRQKVREDMERHARDRVSSEEEARTAQNRLTELQKLKDQLLGSSVKIAAETEEIRKRIDALSASNHQAELARARAESRRATAGERLIEEYGISGDDAIEQSEQVEVPRDAQALVNRLRREIRAMGVVNLGAIEAHERLSSRMEELSAQRADILEGTGQIQSGIRELDGLTKDRFLETFAKVQTAYGNMFLKLFGGGEGHISLDTPDSILESGINIDVTLPGKKRQRLELLSGGERALCAAGFLFALLDVKPSPLVVLDEVDAPLDGRNVERFGDLLAEFTDRTQFIVITHNPTTIERAPVWLGVTMQEPGVSTLIPARLPAVVRVDPPVLAS